MTIKNGQTITASDVTERVNQFIESVGYDKVLEDAADYEKYNSVTGTTLGEEGYNTLISEAPEYLYTLIPEGGATYPSEAEGEEEEVEDTETTGEKVAALKAEADTDADDLVSEEEKEALLSKFDDESVAGKVTEAKGNKKYDLNKDKTVDSADKDIAASEIQVATEDEVEYEYLYNEDTWNASYANGALARYYAQYPDEDRYNTVEDRACNFNDKVYDVEFSDNTTGTFKAHWYTETVQSIINTEDANEVYYLDMFYELNDTDHELFTDVECQTSAGKTAKVTAINWNTETCPQCWKGAINAPGAAWPWVGLTFDEPTKGIVKFVYDDGEPVYPEGNKAKTFNSFYVVSIPKTLGEIADFDNTKLKVYLKK